MRRNSWLFRILLSALPILLYSATPARSVPVPEVTRATLENGMRVVIVRNTLAPVVTTEVNYLAGSNEAPGGYPGMAHALEHMMFRGSPGLSAAQLADITAAMGGDFNADTQQTVTQYFFTVPAEYLDIALHIESIRMKGLLPEEELWTKERGAIDQEVAQDLSNPEYRFYTQLLQAMFSGTPYAHDALGTRDSFAKTTSAMLQTFHRTWYAPNNAVLVIAGDVDPQKALAEVRTLFGPVPSRTLPAKPAADLEPLVAKNISLDTDLPYGLAVVAYRLPGYDSPDYAAGQILADALGSQRGELYGLVPKGKALYAGFQANPLPAASIGFALAAYPQGGNGNDLTVAMKSILSDTLKNGVPDDLVESSKRHEVADAEFEKNSIPGLAAAWSHALAVEGRQSPQQAIDEIRAVTKADVDRVARQYLLNDSTLVAVLTPKSSGKPVSSKGFGGGESFAPNRTESVKLPEWAQKVQETPKAPSSTVNPTVASLDNGLRLIVQPESISPTVTIIGEVKNNSDMETPPGKEGVDQVLGELLSYGTTSMDRIAFRKALDDIAANESAGTRFSLQVPVEHLDRGVELLAANLLQPALPQPAFEVVRKQTAASIAGEMKSPGYLESRAMQNALYPKGDPELRQATPASVNGLSLEDVHAYYQHVFRPDMTTVVVIGEITAEEARAVIEKYFGSWKAEGPKPDTLLPSVPPNNPSTAAVPDASRVQVEVTLAETLGLQRSNPDYYALQLGNHVLSGAFYATRLYHDLREEAGLVYTVESSFDVGRTRSSFSVFYACDPQNVDKARALVVRDLIQMQREPVSTIELQQARNLLVRQIPLSETSEDGIASRLVELSIRDLPLDEPVRAARHYLKITPTEIRDAFARWIRAKDFVQVTLGPTGK